MTNTKVDFGFAPEALSVEQRRRLLEMAKQAKLSRRAVEAIEPIPRAHTAGSFPLSLAQRRLWFLTQLGRASEAYHIGGTLRLVGRLERGVLRDCFQTIVERHEALRTRFVLEAEEVSQLVMPASAAFSWQEFDLRSHAEPEPRLERVLGDFGALAFDVAN